MNTFNNTLKNLPIGGECLPDNDLGTPPDTDSDIGKCGSHSCETANKKVIIKLDSGIEIHMPLDVVEGIRNILDADEQSCSGVPDA